MKRLIILISLMLLLSVSAFGQMEMKFIVNFMFGVNFFSNHTDDFTISFKTNTKIGYSLAGDIVYPILSWLEIGAGVEYQFPRALESDDNQKFNFLPIYGILRMVYTIKWFSFYGVGRLGYNFIFSSDEYENGADLKGSLFWSLGIGVFFKEVFLIETHYSMNMMSRDDGITKKKIYFSHLDVYAGFRLKFNFDKEKKESDNTEE